MTDNEEKSLEELEAEYSAELKKKVQFLKTDNEAKDKLIADEKATKEADELAALKIEEKENLFKEFAEKYKVDLVEEETVDPGAGDAGRTSDNPLADFHAKFIKKSGVARDSYGSESFIAGDLGFAYANPDADCDDSLGDWTKADVFCDLIWHAAQCGKQLSGVITLRACDINAGDGLTVQIRAINASSMGSALTACECATCTSNVFSVYPLTLARYDIFKVLCNLDIFSVGDAYKSAVIETMGRGFITGIDALIWTAISGATPGYTETSAASFTCDPTEPASTCCNYGANLYKEIIELEARMRAAGYGPDFTLILNPRVATYLKYKEGSTYPPWVAEVQMEGNTLIKIGNIKVIEYCGATECTNLGGAVMAIMVDPNRAVGEAYGKRPTFKTDEDPIECDSQKLIMRAYVAVAALDLNAIGHIVNP